MVTWQRGEIPSFCPSRKLAVMADAQSDTEPPRRAGQAASFSRSRRIQIRWLHCVCRELDTAHRITTMTGLLRWPASVCVLSIDGIRRTALQPIAMGAACSAQPLPLSFIIAPLIRPLTCCPRKRTCQSSCPTRFPHLILLHPAMPARLALLHTQIHHLEGVES